MSIRQYQYVLAVASGKTARKTAQEMYVSEATVSQQIKALETELGIALFDRTAGRSLWPTEACKALLPDFQRLIDARAIIHESLCRLKQPTLKPAQFIPTSGHLLCPNCGSLIVVSNGRGWHIHENAGQKWDEMSAQTWQCMKCHRRYALPANPFQVSEEASA